jgi:SAM-dependent methyltransferase
MPISRDEVIWAYRMLLGREPESEDAIRHHMKCKSRLALREQMARSPEFLASRLSENLHADRLNILKPEFTKLEIETDGSDDQLNACFEKIKEAWIHLGIIKPHYSVMNQPDFLPENIGDSIDAFYASGEEEAKVVENILARHDCASLPGKICLEYGSGVGRVTMGLACRFAWVHGYDISPGHLAYATERATEIGLTNITLHLCAENFFEPLGECDVAYSRIVFQHNPPPVQGRLIKSFLRAVKPGGIAIFQVLTYMKDYHFNTHNWLKKRHSLDMQMHCLPQQKIFEIISAESCITLEVGEDNSVGHFDSWMSNTFVVRRLQ